MMKVEEGIRRKGGVEREKEGTWRKKGGKTKGRINKGAKKRRCNEIATHVKKRHMPKISPRHCPANKTFPKRQRKTKGYPRND